MKKKSFTFKTLKKPTDVPTFSNLKYSNMISLPYFKPSRQMLAIELTLKRETHDPFLFISLLDVL